MTVLLVLMRLNRQLGSTPNNKLQLVRICPMPELAIIRETNLP